MGFDLDTTGNSCAESPTNCQLGPIERCVRVDYTGRGFDGVSDYNIDVYIDDPAGSAPAPTAYDAWVYYAPINDGCPQVGAAAESGAQCNNGSDDDGDGSVNDGCPQVGATAESGDQCAAALDEDGDAIVNIASPGTNGKIKIDGAGNFGGGDEANLPTPDADGKFIGGWLNFPPPDPNPGVNTYIGDGPLLRLGLDIDGTKSGVVTFSLDEVGSGYNSAAGSHPLTFQTGQLAINTDCPGVTPTPTPGTPTATPIATPVPTPPPGTIMLVGGWNNVCYVGREQPIEDALAGVADRVLAVYRLRADQGFDTWFPNKPGASNITTISPYQPLFILMSQDASWPHEPSGTPLPSVSLASGWNNVCYTGQTKSAEDATAGVAGGFVIMYQLGNDQSWSWYAPAKSGMGDIAQLSQYDTVLILVNQEGGTTWTFDP
jgi:hypothetical protein